MFFPVAQAAARAAETAEKSGIAAIGLDAKSLILQIINFAILLLILKKFAYKPIVGILEERRRKIEESLKTAKEIEEEKKRMEEIKEDAVKQTNLKSAEIIEQSRKQAGEIIKTAEVSAQKRGEQLLNESRAKIDQEILEAKNSLKTETLSLIAAATEKIIGKKLDSEKDGELIREALKESELKTR